MIKKIVSVSQSRKLLFRIKIKGEPLTETWSRWLIQPSDSYIETEKDGPFPASAVEWIDIDPIEQIAYARKMPLKTIDHTTEFSSLLITQKLNFFIIEKLIRIVL